MAQATILLADDDDGSVRVTYDLSPCIDAESPAHIVAATAIEFIKKIGVTDCTPGALEEHY